MPSDHRHLHLLARVSSAIYAVPVQHVAEVMRALPIRSIQGVPDFVVGVAIIRGLPVPVVNLECLVHGTAAAPMARFVTVNAGERSVALGVASVVGIRELPDHALQRLPPLVQGATASVELIGALDSELLVVLRSSRTIPGQVWSAIEQGEVGPCPGR